MVRADFNFSENGLTASGWVSCRVTSMSREEIWTIPLEWHFTKLFFNSKGAPDFAHIKQVCFDKSVLQIE